MQTGEKASEQQAREGLRPEVLKSGILFNPHPHPGEETHTSGMPSGLYGAALLYDWNEQRLDVVSSNAQGLRR